MRPLPTYRIEPPDILQIDMLKMVPRTPYRIDVYDVLQIGVVGALADHPINDFYLVEAGGIVSLGPAYGNVRVGGMTIDEAKAAITDKLQEILHDPKVSVQLTRTAATQPITRQYLVGPDGTINLRQYGTILMMGKTLTEAKASLEKLLAKDFESHRLRSTYWATTAKCFISLPMGRVWATTSAGYPFPATRRFSTRWPERADGPSFPARRCGFATISVGFREGDDPAIDYNAITQRGATKTNYQIMPGDRIFIAGDSAIALNNKVNKITSPVERILGLISLGAATIDSVEKIWPQQEQQ